jgi:tetratricopeptide (TPR) repeat protein
LEEALHGLEAKRLVLYHLPQAYQLLGKLYKQKGNTEKALELFEKSTDILLEVYTEKRR